MYLRFITQHTTDNEQTTRGFFQAIDFILEQPSILDEDKDELISLYNWFKQNLDAPPWFKNPTYRQYESHSLSWFKHSAKEHIFKVHEISVILERYDLIIERVTTKTPGKIFYEDKYQISAVPFPRDRSKVI